MIRWGCEGCEKADTALCRKCEAEQYDAQHPDHGGHLP